MNEVQSGLEGVVAFATEIAEPDRDGGTLRFRGVNIDELVGRMTYESVWGLLVDGVPAPALPAVVPPADAPRSGDARVDLQVALALFGAAWDLPALIDCSDEQARGDLARATAAALAVAGRGARSADLAPVDPTTVAAGESAAERFLLAWRGEADPRHVTALDAYWVSAAEHGMNASTFTARVIASTGADVTTALSGAIGALSGPLHGGAPARVLTMVEEVERTGDASGWVRAALDRGERLMGFGHRVYRAEDPRARVLRRVARELGSPRVEVAEELERVALDELRARKPDRVLATNVEFWSAVVLDLAQIPASQITTVFACARLAGWSAHVLEQKRERRLVRPSARYVGPPPRELAAPAASG